MVAWNSMVNDRGKRCGKFPVRRAQSVDISLVRERGLEKRTDIPVKRFELYLKGNGGLLEGFKHKRGLNRTTFCVVVKEDLS